MVLGGLNLKRIGDRLRRVDRFLIHIFKVRLANGGLSDDVAESKSTATPDGVFQTQRPEVEDQRIAAMGKWAEENGINPHFARAIMYQVIQESCRRQDEVMFGKYTRRERKIDESDPEAIYAVQRENLLQLTAAIALPYDADYAKDCLGSRLYFSFEKSVLMALVGTIEDNELAVDLGCATGMMSFKVAPMFRRVIGYDISPEMIGVAESKKTPATAHVEFGVSDIENGISLPDASASLVIMNMGTASDVRNIEKVLSEIRRILKPGGKLFITFYNADSLLFKIGFVPWPMPLAAHVDPEKRCLEVRFDGKVYFLYARPRSIHEVHELLSGFEIENEYTFPTLASIIPNIVTEDEDGEGIRTPNEKVGKAIKKIDAELSTSPLHSGTYIVVTARKD